MKREWECVSIVTYRVVKTLSKRCVFGYDKTLNTSDGNGGVTQGQSGRFACDKSQVRFLPPPCFASSHGRAHFLTK